MKEYQKIIKEICQEENIHFTLLSDKFVIELQKNNQRKFIYAYKFPLNNQGLSLILDDKYAFYSILKSLNIKTTKIMPIFPDYNPNSLITYLEKYKTLVVKSNNGTCGKEVFKVKNQVELFSCVDFLLNKNAPVCICPYYEIKNEYRIIVLNSKIKLIYGKKRPIIIGDGIHSVLELLQEFNPNYYTKSKNLEKLNLNLFSILPKNEQLEIDFKFNLSRGGVIFDVTGSLKEKLTSLALLVTKELDIQFASIDIIQTIHDELLVLEANSGIMMDNFIHLHTNGREIAKEIYQEAIQTLFK